MTWRHDEGAYQQAHRRWENSLGCWECHEEEGRTESRNGLGTEWSQSECIGTSYEVSLTTSCMHTYIRTYTYVYLPLYELPTTTFS